MSCSAVSDGTPAQTGRVGAPDGLPTGSTGTLCIDVCVTWKQDELMWRCYRPAVLTSAPAGHLSSTPVLTGQSGDVLRPAAHSVAVATCRPVGVADAVTGMTAAPLLQVVTRCFQLMTSVFQAPPTVAVPYIRALGPPLVRFLQVLMLMV